MKRLTVLYDADCQFCVRCRSWLEDQPKIVDLEFIPARSREAARRLPHLEGADENELVVVSDDGGVYRGARAYIICLWALDRYREWALKLARPGLLPLARTAFEMLSRNRRGLGRLLRFDAASDLACGPQAGPRACNVGPRGPAQSRDLSAKACSARASGSGRSS